jgi:hypothetical protein
VRQAPPQGQEIEVKNPHSWPGRILAIACAMLLSMVMVATAQAQERKDDDGPLGRLHSAEGVKCVQCHGKAKKSEPVPQETCLSCHGKGDSKALAAKTANAKPLNPHENRHYGTEADCGLCHRQHEKSVNFCLDCHPRFDFKLK